MFSKIMLREHEKYLVNVHAYGTYTNQLIGRLPATHTSL